MIKIFTKSGISIDFNGISIIVTSITLLCYCNWITFGMAFEGWLILIDINCLFHLHVVDCIGVHTGPCVFKGVMKKTSWESLHLTFVDSSIKERREKRIVFSRLFIKMKGKSYTLPLFFVIQTWILPLIFWVERI